MLSCRARGHRLRRLLRALVDHERGRLVLTGATPPFDRLAGSIEVAIGEGVAGWVAAHGEPVVILENKRADPRYRHCPITTWSFPSRTASC